MFSNACQLFWPLVCQVGGGSVEVEGRLYGTGCEIGPEHVLTARHIWEEIRRRYSWPVVFKHDGLFRCEVAFESSEDDLCLLHATEVVQRVELGVVGAFPPLQEDALFYGSQVGYIARLRYPDDAGVERSRGYFGAGFLSMLVGDAGEGSGFMLSGGIIQQGFSGAPAFTPEGTLAGILTQSWQLSFMDAHPVRQSYTSPVMSPVWTCQDRINEAME